MGAACRAAWSGDGLTYPARVVALSPAEGTCMVEYEHYGNREEQSLRDLLPPDQTPNSSPRPGRTVRPGGWKLSPRKGAGLGLGQGGVEGFLLQKGRRGEAGG